MQRLVDAYELYVDARCGENEEPCISLYQINNAPTVDIDAITESHEKIGYDKGFRDGYAQATSEVRHGHWINHFDDLFPMESTVECSICGEKEWMMTIINHNYCPNCGAKMDEEGEDGHGVG